MAGKFLKKAARTLKTLTRATAKKLDITFHRIGSMFCLFFACGPIVDLAGKAQRSESIRKIFPAV